MVRYLYNKYNAVATYQEPNFVNVGKESKMFNDLYMNAKWNANTSKFDLDTLWNGFLVNGNIGYKTDGNVTTKYIANDPPYGGGARSVNVLVVCDKYVATITPAYSKGTLVAADIKAENGTYPTNGRHTDGFWYVRGEVIPTFYFDKYNTVDAYDPNINNWNWGNPVSYGDYSTTDVYPSILVSGNTIGVTGAAFKLDATKPVGSVGYRDFPTIDTIVKHTKVAANSHQEFSLLKSSQVPKIKQRGTLNMSNIIAESGFYPDNGVHTDGFWYVKKSTTNLAPTITLNTTDNRKLYENDTLSIDGTTTDTDKGNVVTVRYSLNGGTTRAIATAISEGVPIPFSKVLQVKNSKLMDGETVLLDNLVEGQANTLRVWASDDKDGESSIQIRTFYVTPNRPPSLTIDSFTQKVGLIDSDHITITGSVADPEGGNVVVKYQIGEVNPVQVHDGPGGTFTFDIPLANLVDGENSIILLGTDSLNFTSQKTLKVTKAVNKTELLQSVRRYKALPPKGSAKNVIIWVQRDINLSLTAEASMVMQNEPENFVVMTKTNSAPVTDTIMEDEFTISSDVPKDDIVFQFNMTRSSIDSTESIHLISGGFE
ncbi:hypothetical protein MKZ20_17465 [Psychrobacillus sp. FSL K6-2684]|uniref:hypothetical protein n=1 Tax=Psychrobacillus sp. FSL K6-2684 TaxID=2921547 RepID=UPI0030F84E08